MKVINETRNYNMFRFTDWNRDISEKNLNKIDKSVKAEGWKKHPVIVNEKMEVIDGQHRIIYAKTHNLPVYYIVIGGLDSKDCVDMNNARTSWTTVDYVKYWASKGYASYIDLQNVINTYNFAPISTIVGMVKDEVANGFSSHKIRNGTFTITEKELKEVREKYNFLQELAPYVKAVRGRQACLYGALSYCYACENVDINRLKRQVKKLLATITPPVDIDMAISEVERIYNKNIRQSEYVEIKAEYKKMLRQKQQKQAQFLREINKERYAKRRGR